jgi:two-component system cell cycle response regulator DivK
MNAKILLVEDNAANRYLVTFLLENSGFKVAHASTGAEALEQVQRETPDLVLMDIQMPDMDGYEATRRIHALPGSSTVPIIAVTSHALSGDREKALQLGCAGYLEKPIVTETFVAEISQYLPTECRVPGAGHHPRA